MPTFWPIFHVVLNNIEFQLDVKLKRDHCKPVTNVSHEMLEAVNSYPIRLVGHPGKRPPFPNCAVCIGMCA